MSDRPSHQREGTAVSGPERPAISPWILKRSTDSASVPVGEVGGQPTRFR